jgi:glycine amidinotransferase/scyllo-inosamine-4-phosphate amidinotransferase 1
MYGYCPRDRVLIAGQKVVDVAMMYPCRNQEFKSLEHAWVGYEPVIMPKNSGMILDAANICRLGDTWLFLESFSGNRSAYEWLCKQFPAINIELVNFYAGVHIDSTVVPLREGLVLLNGHRVNESNCPQAFKSWTKIYVDEVVAQNFYQYPYASKWIALNMLVLDPHTVICDRHQTNLIKLLEQHKFTVIPLELRHSRTLGGGFHCVTLDTWREHA